MYQIIIIAVILILGILDTSVWFHDYSDILYLHELDKEDIKLEECIQDTNITEDFHNLTLESPQNNLENKDDQNHDNNASKPENVAIVESESEIPPIVKSSEELFSEVMSEELDFDSDIVEMVEDQDCDNNVVNMYGGGANNQSIQDMLAKLKSTISQDIEK